MIEWTLRPGAHPEQLGLIPGFLDPDDPRPAREQFDAKYISGWRPQEGFVLPEGSVDLHYPGDPPMKALAFCRFRKELVFVYEHAYVAILTKEKLEVCRMD